MTRHAAPDVGHDPATCPMCLRAAWVAEHHLRHLPERIRRHQLVQVLEVAR